MRSWRQELGGSWPRRIWVTKGLARTGEVMRAAGASSPSWRSVVGSPGALQPPAPTDPGVTVSRHRALLTSCQYARTHRQWANSPGSRWSSPVHHRLNRLTVRSRLYFFLAQRLR
jgi:hypothetical protein